MLKLKSNLVLLLSSVTDDTYMLKEGGREIESKTEDTWKEGVKAVEGLGDSWGMEGGTKERKGEVR